MRIWVLVTTLLIVSILTTEVFGKESKSETNEITNGGHNLDNNKKETIKSESKKEVSGKEDKHLREQNKSKKKKNASPPSIEVNPEISNSVGSRGSKKSRKSQKLNQSDKHNNKQRKQWDKLESQNTIGQKVRHEKEKYKNKGINEQAKSNKKHNKREKKDLKHINEVKGKVGSDNKKSDNPDLDVVIENNRLRKKHRSKNIVEEIDLTIDNKSNSDRKNRLKKNKCKDCNEENVGEESKVLNNVEEETGKITKKKKKRSVDSKTDKKWKKKLSRERNEAPVEDNENEDNDEEKEKLVSSSENEIDYEENMNADKEDNCYASEGNHDEEDVDEEKTDA
ncbi:uncharacterized protein DDB_G0283697-like [Polistes fuscatus]|uniref:uncharacterized protein DDB_G0283697-like n=1 Tax=Polistes fuscatus TaxID=30207 RepID=UPI001CAA16A3|nr:uncharacterized protein DDB_G0283697-like [Polistes fuscatus]